MKRTIHKISLWARLLFLALFLFCCSISYALTHIYAGQYTYSSKIIYSWDGKHLYSGAYAYQSKIIYTFDGEHIYIRGHINMHPRYSTPSTASTCTPGNTNPRRLSAPSAKDISILELTIMPPKYSTPSKGSICIQVHTPMPQRYSIQ